MIGAIAGDMIGSVHEFHPHKSKQFPLFDPRSYFTDDSVMTIAIARAILDQRPYQDCALELGRLYPDAGYGGSFYNWLFTDHPQPYNSWGNGSAMRVSPVGWAFDTRERVLSEAAASASFSHNHPEGIKGAQAAALAIWLARNGATRAEIRQDIETTFGYDLKRTVHQIRPSYLFEVSCQRSVPEAIICFLDSTSWEDAVRNAVSLGGDADTQACIAGGIAEAFYGPVGPEVVREVKERLTPELWEVTRRFRERYVGGTRRAAAAH
jgi:ADP-ribosylglycohydrolase